MFATCVNCLVRQFHFRVLVNLFSGLSDMSLMCGAVQGVLGIKVKIMLDWDPKGKLGPITPLPDLVTIHAPKEEDELRPPVLVPEV